MDQSCHFLPKMAPFRRCSSYLNSPQFLQGRPFAQDMHFISDLPERTDDGEKAVPFLKTLEKVHEPPGPKMSRQQMYEFLLGQRGALCAGCDPTFDDPRYLELDHNTPRSDGGINHISNVSFCAVHVTGSIPTPTRCRACADRTRNLVTWRTKESTMSESEHKITRILSTASDNETLKVLKDHYARHRESTPGVEVSDPHF